MTCATFLGAALFVGAATGVATGAASATEVVGLVGVRSESGV